MGGIAATAARPAPWSPSSSQESHSQKGLWFLCCNPSSPQAQPSLLGRVPGAGEGLGWMPVGEGAGRRRMDRRRLSRASGLAWRSQELSLSVAAAVAAQTEGERASSSSAPGSRAFKVSGMVVEAGFPKPQRRQWGWVTEVWQTQAWPGLTPVPSDPRAWALLRGRLPPRKHFSCPESLPEVCA